jgi:NAD(P)-dependent dehydrogenase (short-subunit alcohol dehydrogenase family)
MPDWYERITQETPPDILAEHDLRYALVAPLIAECKLWCDLGCGTGIGAAAALAGRRPGGRVVLVDNDADAIATARGELGVGDAVSLTADLASPDGLARVREHVAGEEGTVITCFEVIEHLESFVPLVTMLCELVEGGGTTVVMSVPNDAFWNMRNPYHLAKWGEGAMAELRSVLPADHVVLHQVALSGSAVLPADAEERYEVPVQARATGEPSHFIVAMGTQAPRVQPGAQVAQVDTVAQRSWERQREAHLAVAEATLAAQSKWFEEWRTHIHNLERELGRPLSGTGDDESPPSS